MTKYEEMKAIRDEVLHLTQSPIYQYRTSNHYFPVIGEGSHDATIMFVGEAPGRNEAETGRPFCGAAGKILDELLNSIHLDRKHVYITNIVKDRPPENREPTPEEIALYGPFLKRQVQIIQPKVLATLGRFSMQYVLEWLNMPEKLESISALHGVALQTIADYGPLHILPLYHPAVAIYNHTSKATLMTDFLQLKQFTEIP